LCKLASGGGQHSAARPGRRAPITPPNRVAIRGNSAAPRSWVETFRRRIAFCCAVGAAAVVVVYTRRACYETSFVPRTKRYVRLRGVWRRRRLERRDATQRAARVATIVERPDWIRGGRARELRCRDSVAPPNHSTGRGTPPMHETGPAVRGRTRLRTRESRRAGRPAVTRAAPALSVAMRARQGACQWHCLARTLTLLRKTRLQIAGRPRAEWAPRESAPDRLPEQAGPAHQAAAGTAIVSRPSARRHRRRRATAHAHYVTPIRGLSIYDPCLGGLDDSRARQH
jgi:hypothetical protein